MSRPITVPDVRAAKGAEPLVMLTAYDAPTTRWGEAADADILLVGDSLAMVVLGHTTTLTVTLEEMLHHARAVTRAAGRCLVVGDLPFGSYQAGVADAVRSGIRYLKEAGVHAVKLEGLWPDHVRGLCDAGIPVMGHLGLTPQSVHRFGGYRVQGRRFEDAQSILEAARTLEACGCFSLVLEGLPAEVASVVTHSIGIPTIGIGAGPDCDGQVLVIHDLLGISPPPYPRFVAPYAALSDAAVEAAHRWVVAVRAREAPTADQSYHLAPEIAKMWRDSQSEA
jgi:3-methyl-2-oxobutanoate hydroxymethyltransferase